jgi:hypothetical protein
MPVTFDLLLLSLPMIGILVRWTFKVLARRLCVCLLQQILLGPDDGEAWMAVRLRLVLVSVVIASDSSINISVAFL